MKKVIAILLLCLIVIHNMGYFFIYSKIRIQHVMDWQKNVEQSSFSLEQLQMASIAITFPYQPDQKEFESVDETILLNGDYYHIIKKRYEAGMLYIVYVDDRTTIKVQNEFEDWSASKNSQHPNPQTIDLKNVFQNIDHLYFYSEFTFTSLSTDILSRENKNFYLDQSSEIFLSIPAPPPKYFS